uniref:SGNH hydrolase-type esterase domain-containing protein n=1 Tax=Salmo trutta TaxID=8032 RepID=A0A674BQH6_SALTR
MDTFICEKCIELDAAKERSITLHEEIKHLTRRTRKNETNRSWRACFLPPSPDLRLSNCLETLYQLSSAGDLGVPSIAVDAPPATSPCPSQSTAWAEPGPPWPQSAGPCSLDQSSVPLAVVACTQPAGRIIATIVIRSLMVRHISVPGAKTLCFPEAKVQDINRLLPKAVRQSPGADTAVVHLGSNDIMKGSSEKLKMDFKEMIGSLLDTNKRPIISDPLPSLNRGRLVALHNWLRDYCSSVGVTFIDNFDIFWKKSLNYKEDGIHLNHLCSWILSQHYTAVLRQ